MKDNNLLNYRFFLNSHEFNYFVLSYSTPDLFPAAGLKYLLAGIFKLRPCTCKPNITWKTFLRNL